MTTRSTDGGIFDSHTQAEKFADLARELGCDESEEGFDERLRGILRSTKVFVKDDGHKAEDT